MQPANFTERKRRILTFTGLYAASVILIFFIFSAFGFHFSGTAQKANVFTATNTQPAAIDDEILRADSLLHAALNQLQQSDDKYTLTVTDALPVPQRNNAAAAVNQNELLFKKTIDSLDQLSVDYIHTDKASLYSLLVSSFRSILNNRLAIKDIQTSMASGKTILSDGQIDVLQLKNQLTQKDSALAKMEQQVKTLENNSFTPVKSAGDDEAKKGEIDLLKTAFNDQQKEYQALQEKYNHLKADNNNLATQIVEYKKSATIQPSYANTVSVADNKVNENKMNALQQKVLELNADVYFTKIDCNLTRADAQQIISNARQRKELLEESLSMLNSLAASGDAGIQKKAKEKIVRLNHIATTLHD